MVVFLQKRLRIFDYQSLKLSIKEIHYISPSLLPSRSANSVHVSNQCDALAHYSQKVYCYARRSILRKKLSISNITKTYGLSSDNLFFKTYFLPFGKAQSFFITFLALFNVLLTPSAKILSRNLYASFILSIFLKRKLLFETHQVEYGFRKYLQRWVMTSSLVKTIVISKKLEEILTEEHGVDPYHTIVLPDAAPDGLLPATLSSRPEKLLHIPNIPRANWNSVCGYFGQLYEGRGIEVIEAMAAERPNTLFLVYGGEPNDVCRCREKNSYLANMFFGGHVSHPEAQQLMRCVDCLLMPYQISVSIGVKVHDTGKWMSPMKMFEYMAAGVPIISSDLPVLREILINKKNALLVSPSDSTKWCEALDRLINNPELSNSIGKQAHLDYLEKYTWGARARAIISLFD
jgi:glycosyltransferase involved in cell wall biosynthesis